MWDYGVRVPLWDEEGLLPDDPDWLRRVLGLSDALIEDLTRWGLDMTEMDSGAVQWTAEVRATLNARGRALAHRVQEVAGSRYTVRYHPW